MWDHQMMHGKAIWKAGIGEISKASRGNATRWVYSTPNELPAAKGQHADAHWVMTYGYKTQSFMKNGGQEKYLDKALNRNIYLWSSLVNVPCFF